MKIRKGFVSNSSTSSFVCDYCGQEVDGMDLSLDEAGMYKCANGHTFCESHTKIDYYNSQHLKDLIASHLQRKAVIFSDRAAQTGDEHYVKWVKEKNEDLRTLISLDGEELDDWLDNEGSDYKYDLRWEIPSEYCPLCKFEKVTDKDMKKYLLGVYKTDYQSVQEEMKNRFSSYENFIAWYKEQTHENP